MGLHWLAHLRKEVPRHAGGLALPKSLTPNRGFAVGDTCVGVDALFFTSPLHAGVVAVRHTGRCQAMINTETKSLTCVTHSNVTV